MRISPKSLSPAEALSRAKAKKQARDDERRQSQESAPEEDADAVAVSPGSIDAGRAQRLLERAASLAERGDMGAAVLATRQSLALAPDSVEAHLLHARLLERNRDFGGARAAYEKSVQLAPDRQDARDNLARLDTYLEKSQGAARQFHFDADELFSPGADSNSPAASAPDKAGAIAPSILAPQAATPDDSSAIAPVLAAPAAPQAPTQTPEFDVAAMLDESMLPGVEARLPPTRLGSAASTAVSAADAKNGKQAPEQSAFMAQAEAPKSEAPKSEAHERISPTVAPAAPVGDRRKHNSPVVTERRHRPATGAVAAAVPIAVGAAGAVPVAASAASNASNPVPVPLKPAPLRPVPSNPAANPFDLDAQVSRPATTRVPLALDIPTSSAAPLWQQVISRPSFYARTLPLVGVALLSLGFLSWARGRAVSQVVAPVPTELASAETVVIADAPPTVPGTTLPLPNNPAQPANSASGSATAGFPITNAPAVFQAPPATDASAPAAPATSDASANPTGNSGRASNNGRSSGNRNSAPSTTARANNRGPNSNSGSGARPQRVLPPARLSPSFPRVSLAPAPIPPSSVRSTIPSPSAPRGDNGRNIILPSPNIEMPAAPAPRQRVLPPTDNALNPAGSPNRGYARVTEGRVGNGVIPSQPSAVARDNERQANESARNGQNDQAISQLSQAIRADSDNAGFRYQQRAMLFLQRGDYNRASDDFQSAISAYQAQINNGDDVAGARRGLSAARSGLSLALAGRRG